MTIESYWIFVTACIVLCITPGPDMAYLVARSVAQGRRAGLAAALGINLGTYVHLLAAVLGISAVIAASSVAFTVLKWCGALYLIYLGVQAVCSKRAVSSNTHAQLSRVSAKTVFWQGFISDVLNPKVAIFYIALLPQFVQVDAGNTLAQLLMLGLTVNVIGLLTNLLIVQFSFSLTSRLRSNQHLTGVLQKAMGAVFIGLGLRLASESR